MDTNPILAVDSYKASHWRQYPPGTTHVSSYVEARGGLSPRTLLMGWQAALKEGPLSRKVEEAHVEEAADVFGLHGLPFNREGWLRVARAHGGRLPLSIQALPEGASPRLRTPLLQVANTDPALPWLTSWAETSLLRAIWYPTTVATRSWRLREALGAWLRETADDPESVLPFMLHDFGARGASSAETAALGGLAHLVSFRGTDTVEALLAARRIYGEPMAGLSIPAAEHATITAWGREGEGDAYAHILAEFGGPGRTVAVVSDSYDLMAAVRGLWGGRLREQVLASGGRLVVRPDSGHPPTVVREVVEALAIAFGFSTNGRGYRVLHPAVRVIQGDGVDPERIHEILQVLARAGFSAENVAFGMGGALLQRLDRDTHGFAMKASAIRRRGGPWEGIAKAPATDPAKASRAGRLAVVAGPSGVEAVAEDALGGRENLLREIWRDGTLLAEESFGAVRARAAGPHW